jgi:disulfide bond formation protein DsbB
MVEVDVMPPPHSREESAFVEWALPTIASSTLVQNGGQCPPYGLLGFAMIGFAMIGFAMIGFAMIGFAMIGRDESRPYEIFAFAAPNWSMVASTRGFGMTH